MPQLRRFGRPFPGGRPLKFLRVGGLGRGDVGGGHGDVPEDEVRTVVDDTTAGRQNFSKMLVVFGCIGTDLCK